MISPSLKNHLTELLSGSFHTKQIDEIGNLLFSSYNSNKLSNTPEHISISPRKAAKILVAYSEKNNKLFQLIKLTIELDDSIFFNQHIHIQGIEVFLNQLAREGMVYDFKKRKLLKKDRDIDEMINWGSLRDGKIYDTTVMSVDIVGNSKLVKKYGINKMEKIYFQLWDFLKVRLKNYDGRIWSWAGDGGIFAFVFKNHQERAVFCGIEIQSLMSIFNLHINVPFKDRISLRIGLDTGRLRFFSDTGKIVSEIINYAAHLEKKGTEAGKVSISRALHDSLPETVFDLFKPAGVFEDRDYFSLPNRLDTYLYNDSLKTDLLQNLA